MTPGPFGRPTLNPIVVEAKRAKCASPRVGALPRGIASRLCFYSLTPKIIVPCVLVLFVSTRRAPTLPLTASAISNPSELC